MTENPCQFQVYFIVSKISTNETLKLTVIRRITNTGIFFVRSKKCVQNILKKYFQNFGSLEKLIQSLHIGIKNGPKENNLRFTTKNILEIKYKNRFCYLSDFGHQETRIKNEEYHQCQFRRP